MPRSAHTVLGIFLGIRNRFHFPQQNQTQDHSRRRQQKSRQGIQDGGELRQAALYNPCRKQYCQHHGVVRGDGAFHQAHKREQGSDGLDDNNDRAPAHLRRGHAEDARQRDARKIRDVRDTVPEGAHSYINPRRGVLHALEEASEQDF